MSLLRPTVKQKKSGVYLLKDNHEKFAKQFRHMDTRVAAGIPQDVGSAKHPGGDEGLTIAQVAIVNEFGSGTDSTIGGKQVTIPARPFISASIRKHAKKYGNMLVKILKDYGSSFKAHKSGAVKEADPKILEGALNALGLIAVRDIQQYMSEPGNFVKNADYTIAKKKSDNPLIDSGLMRQSIQHRIEKKKKRAKRS